MNNSVNKVGTSKLDNTLNWLIDGAPPHETIKELFTELALRLTSTGVPLAAMVVNGFFIHPHIRGIRNSWTVEHGYKQRTFDRDYIESPDFRDTPHKDILDNPREIRYRFDESDRETTSLYRSAFQKLGYTDLILQPLVNVDGTVTGSVEFATKCPQGFSDEHYQALCKLRNPIARLKEYYTERFDKKFTLSTYIGREASRKVLKGQIVLGDGEMISAVILFADLSNFTRLSEKSDPSDVLRVLNHFFFAIGDSVERRNGEILKFIGDAIFVIFAVSDDPEARKAAANNALASIKEARDTLASSAETADIHFVASLHLGNVFFGNVGTGKRLDFTAIGPAVNLASRMLSEASRRCAQTICSLPFLGLTKSQDATRITCHFRGIEHRTDVFLLKNV